MYPEQHHGADQTNGDHGAETTEHLVPEGAPVGLRLEPPPHSMASLSVVLNTAESSFRSPVEKASLEREAWSSPNRPLPWVDITVATIDQLREMAEAGEIGSVADQRISFMGAQFGVTFSTILLDSGPAAVQVMLDQDIVAQQFPVCLPVYQALRKTVLWTWVAHRRSNGDQSHFAVFCQAKGAAVQFDTVGWWRKQLKRACQALLDIDEAESISCEMTSTSPLYNTYQCRV